MSTVNQVVLRHEEACADCAITNAQKILAHRKEKLQLMAEQLEKDQHQLIQLINDRKNAKTIEDIQRIAGDALDIATVV